MASEVPPTEPFVTKLIYNVFDRNAKKIATLVRMANLNYQTETLNEDGSLHVLQTPYGELSNEYEIIYYIINESRQLGQKENSVQAEASDVSERISEQQHLATTRGVAKLESEDKFISAKMMEKLFELRCTLFPLLHQFYQYLTGKEKTRKSKYDSLMNKIKKEVGKLDADINEHPELYHGEFNFLNILIACELFMACKFVFEEKFRKSKYSLFNKYDKISHREEFVDVHGKSDLCQKEYIPTQFTEEEPLPEPNLSQKDLPLPPEIIKLSSNIISHSDPNRNELLYNYFRNTFSNLTESKASYFPYFWLMFQDLNCSLVEIIQPVGEENKESSTLKLKDLHRKIMNGLNTEVDYGMVGLYQSEKDKQFIIRGIVCLGSKTFQEFEVSVHSNNDFEEIKLHKVRTGVEKEKKEVESLWEHSVESSVQEEIGLVVILHI